MMKFVFGFFGACVGGVVGTVIAILFAGIAVLFHAAISVIIGGALVIYPICFIAGIIAGVWFASN